MFKVGSINKPPLGLGFNQVYNSTYISCPILAVCCVFFYMAPHTDETECLPKINPGAYKRCKIVVGSLVSSKVILMVSMLFDETSDKMPLVHCSRGDLE